MWDMSLRSGSRLKLFYFGMATLLCSILTRRKGDPHLYAVNCGHLPAPRLKVFLDVGNEDAKAERRQETDKFRGNAHT